MACGTALLIACRSGHPPRCVGTRCTCFVVYNLQNVAWSLYALAHRLHFLFKRLAPDIFCPHHVLCALSTKPSLHRETISVA